MAPLAVLTDRLGGFAAVGKRQGVLQGLEIPCGGFSVSAGEFHSPATGDAHAFVQVLDGVTGDSAYHRYPLTDFWASEKDFEVRIGPNLFTQDRMVLDINRPEGQLRGELRFRGVTPWRAGH